MKVFNIILSCVLILGLTASCGSKGKKAGKSADKAAADEGWTVLF